MVTGFMIGSLANAQLASEQVCNSEEIKIQLQKRLDAKNSHYQPRVDDMTFVTQLENNKKINVFAGADDIDISNTFGVPVEIYKSESHDLADIKFDVVIVDTTKCSILETRNIFTTYNN